MGKWENTMADKNTASAEFSNRELEEIKTALLLSQAETMGYPFKDEETKEILSVIGTARGKIEEKLELLNS